MSITAAQCWLIRSSSRTNGAVNLEEAARTTYAALLLSAGDPSRVPQVPARFLAAVGHGDASA